MHIDELSADEINLVTGGAQVKAQPGGVPGGVGGNVTVTGGSNNGNSGDTDYDRRTDDLVTRNNSGLGTNSNNQTCSGSQGPSVDGKPKIVCP